MSTSTSQAPPPEVRSFDPPRPQLDPSLTKRPSVSAESPMAHSPFITLGGPLRPQDSTPTSGIGSTLRITNPDLPPELATRRDQYNSPAHRGTHRTREGTPQPPVTWLLPPETDKLTLSIGGPLRITNPDIPPRSTAPHDDNSSSSRRGHEASNKAREHSPQPPNPSFSPVEIDNLMLSIGGPLRVTNPDLSPKSASRRGKSSSQRRRDRKITGRAEEGSSPPPLPSLRHPYLRNQLGMCGLRSGNASRSRQGYNPAGEGEESSPQPPTPPFSSTQTEKSQPLPLANDQVRTNPEGKFLVTMSNEDSGSLGEKIGGKEHVRIERKERVEVNFHQGQGAAGRKGEGRRTRKSRAGKQGQEAENEVGVSEAREQELKKREEEIKRKELDFLRNEENAKRRDEEIRRREEELEEAIYRFEEERKEAKLKEEKLCEEILRLEEERKDAGRKEEEFRKRTRRLEAEKAEVRQREEEVRKREEELQRRESEITARHDRQKAGFHEREEQAHCQERAGEVDWRPHCEQGKPDLPLSADDKENFNEIGVMNAERRRMDEIWEQKPIEKVNRKQADELQGTDQQVKECVHPEQTTWELAKVSSSQPFSFSWTSPQVQTWGSYRSSFFSPRTSPASYSTTLEHTDDDMADWQRRQEELYQKQREQFRQEQERLETFKQPCGLGWMLNTT